MSSITTHTCHPPKKHPLQLISLLARLGLVKWSWRRAMLDPHLPALLALVRRVRVLAVHFTHTPGECGGLTQARTCTPCWPSCDG